MSAAQAGGRWCAQSTHGTGIKNAARPGIIGRGPAAKCRHHTPSRFSGKGPSPVGSKQSASSALCWAPICRSLAPAARRVGAGQNDTAEREQLPCRSGRCGQEGQRRAGRRHSRPCLRRKCAGWAARRHPPRPPPSALGGAPAAASGSPSTGSQTAAACGVPLQAAARLVRETVTAHPLHCPSLHCSCQLKCAHYVLLLVPAASPPPTKRHHALAAGHVDALHSCSHHAGSRCATHRTCFHQLRTAVPLCCITGWNAKQKTQGARMMWHFLLMYTAQRAATGESAPANSSETAPAPCRCSSACSAGACTPHAASSTSCSSDDDPRSSRRCCKSSTPVGVSEAGTACCCSSLAAAADASAPAGACCCSAAAATAASPGSSPTCGIHQPTVARTAATAPPQSLSAGSSAV